MRRKGAPYSRIVDGKKDTYTNIHPIIILATKCNATQVKTATEPSDSITKNPRFFHANSHLTQISTALFGTSLRILSTSPT